MDARLKSVAPVLFREDFAFVHYPIIMYGNHSAEDFIFWNRKPIKEVVLTQEELIAVNKWFLHFRHLYSLIHDTLHSAYDFKGKTSVSLRLWASLVDLDSASALCELGYSLLNAYFMTIQSAEKSMKAYLSWCGVTDERLKELSHNRNKLVLKCAELDEGFKGFVEPVESLKWNQDWRYKPVQIRKHHLAHSFDVSLQLCGQVCHSIRNPNSSA